MVSSGQVTIQGTVHEDYKFDSAWRVQNEEAMEVITKLGRGYSLSGLWALGRREGDDDEASDT
jgi:hypothetical protein